MYKNMLTPHTSPKMARDPPKESQEDSEEEPTRQTNIYFSAGVFVVSLTWLLQSLKRGPVITWHDCSTVSNLITLSPHGEGTCSDMRVTVVNTHLDHDQQKLIMYHGFVWENQTHDDFKFVYITSVTSAQLGWTFQEFPKWEGSTSSWLLLLTKSLLMFPSKFPHKPHTRP